MDTMNEINLVKEFAVYMFILTSALVIGAIWKGIKTRQKKKSVSKPIHKPKINAIAKPQKKTSEIKPKRLFHGTSMENALEIYNTRYWLIGDRDPPGIYLTTKIEIAKTYAGKDGAIVVIFARKCANIRKLPRICLSSGSDY